MIQDTLKNGLKVFRKKSVDGDLFVPAMVKEIVVSDPFAIGSPSGGGLADNRGDAHLWQIRVTAAQVQKAAWIHVGNRAICPSRTPHGGWTTRVQRQGLNFRLRMTERDRPFFSVILLPDQFPVKSFTDDERRLPSETK